MRYRTLSPVIWLHKFARKLCRLRVFIVRPVDCHVYLSHLFCIDRCHVLLLLLLLLLLLFFLFGQWFVIIICCLSVYLRQSFVALYCCCCLLLLLLFVFCFSFCFCFFVFAKRLHLFIECNCLCIYASVFVGILVCLYSNICFKNVFSCVDVNICACKYETWYILCILAYHFA